MLEYIQSKENAKIKKAYKLLKDAKYRNEHGQFFAATPKVVMDILKSGFKAESLFFVLEDYEKYKQFLSDKKVYIITQEISQKLSEDKTSQGVFAIFDMKNSKQEEIFASKKVLILEDVQDPGNVGAIMRTALAFGYNDVVVSNRCADIYSHKVLRSSMTASVKLNVLKVENVSEFVEILSKKGFSTVSTCLENSIDLGNQDIPLPIAVVIGNEGNGISQQTIKNSKYKVKIPMSEKIESLNAAISAAIIMWQFKGE